MRRQRHSHDSCDLLDMVDASRLCQPLQKLNWRTARLSACGLDATKPRSGKMRDLGTIRCFISSGSSALFAWSIFSSRSHLRFSKPELGVRKDSRGYSDVRIREAYRIAISRRRRGLGLIRHPRSRLGLEIQRVELCLVKQPLSRGLRSSSPSLSSIPTPPPATFTRPVAMS